MSDELACPRILIRSVEFPAITVNTVAPEYVKFKRMKMKDERFINMLRVIGIFEESENIMIVILV